MGGWQGKIGVRGQRTRVAVAAAAGCCSLRQSANLQQAMCKRLGSEQTGKAARLLRQLSTVRQWGFGGKAGLSVERAQAPRTWV